MRNLFLLFIIFNSRFSDNCEKFAFFENCKGNRKRFLDFNSFKHEKHYILRVAGTAVVLCDHPGCFTRKSFYYNVG